jgi:hypothetical protein
LPGECGDRGVASGVQVDLKGTEDLNFIVNDQY